MKLNVTGYAKKCQLAVVSHHCLFFILFVEKQGIFSSHECGILHIAMVIILVRAHVS